MVSYFFFSVYPNFPFYKRIIRIGAFNLGKSLIHNVDQSEKDYKVLV